ncbi:dna topoisomerase 2-alpha-like protein [Dermatophagoides farinae]|uniref:DNA topoisomerase (ATP-hydrolyzing) n=1 Tax=Dermatophagoides farinae TaxID=6954 RepID=A0A9D4NWD7_DERFA|nr:dna topoisomerase 2-alpha-like protein [Dermatophagoides farinae]
MFRHCLNVVHRARHTTEGVSAKNLVNDGFSVGLDKFGIFSLRGTMLNVRDASDSQIMENDEIKNLATILGLKYDLKYTFDEIKSLRYGKVIIVTDGSHIAGLILNFFHFMWADADKLDTPEKIDRYISAQIPPDNPDYEFVREIVLKHMVHTCMPNRCLNEDGECNKNFKSPFVMTRIDA